MSILVTGDFCRGSMIKIHSHPLELELEHKTERRPKSGINRGKLRRVALSDTSSWPLDYKVQVVSIDTLFSSSY